MAQQTINVNGTAQVFNAVLLTVNGDSGVEINGYIKNIRFTTGTQSEHVTTINPLAQSIDVNPVCSTPSGSITFVSGNFENFYQFLNDRYTRFSLSFIQYTTGDLDGATRTLAINNAKIDDISGSSDAGSPNNMNTMGFKCTNIAWI